MQQVNMMHVMLVSPLLIYIGKNKQKTPQWAYTSLMALSLMIPFIVRFPQPKMEYRHLVNANHYMITMPFLLYVAYKGDSIDHSIYPMLLYTGYLLLVIHGYLIVNSYIK